MTFEYTDPDGDTISVEVAERDDGQRVVALIADERRDHTTIHIPLGRVEELVAGIRDTARQAATAQPAAEGQQ